MDDLSFTPNHDLFANMAITQEVADNIARTLNGAPGEGSLPSTEVLSVQPLAVRNSETTQANPASTPSSIHAAPPPTSRAGALQPGTSAVNTGRCIIRSSVKREPSSKRV
ncbi:hypothetical protein LIER_11156 [Lithospermum erythrorhizon]|uniref:Uncharacterized protein n=1 Tax=Lithospermum erythrorhizon TaxID=34254 RepID=A0AAV3PMA6_LITER